MSIDSSPDTMSTDEQTVVYRRPALRISATYAVGDGRVPESMEIEVDAALDDLPGGVGRFITSAVAVLARVPAALDTPRIGVVIGGVGSLPEEVAQYLRNTAAETRSPEEKLQRAQDAAAECAREHTARIHDLQQLVEQARRDKAVADAAADQGDAKTDGDAGDAKMDGGN